MKKFFGILLIIIAANAVNAQKVYFLYLQTEQEQPFFVKIGDKVYSSSASGYLVLSNLHDSTYNFSVGFPQNKWPEQKFSVKMNAKDHGYMVKNFGDKGWGLFDLQTMAVQMAAMNEEKNSSNSVNTNVSSFTEVLAKATDDSTLKQKPVDVAIKETKTETTIQPTEKAKEIKTSLIEQPVNNTASSKIDTVQQIIKKQEVESVQSESYKRSVVTRKSESSTTKGLGLVYVDDYGNGTKDTIQIIIPNSKPSDNAIKEEPKQEKKFLYIGDNSEKINNVDFSEKDQNSKETKIGQSTDESQQSKTITKNNCISVAADSDFYALRKNMAAEASDDEMIDAAKKYFKTKCFLVSQLKNLNALFLNDAGKYKFFDAAYGHVTDTENFGTLQSELKDEYYINRFKAMLH